MCTGLRRNARADTPHPPPLHAHTHTQEASAWTPPGTHTHAHTRTHTHRGTISHGPTHWGQRGTMREQASMHARASSPEPPPHPNNHTQAPAFTHAGMPPPPILACLQTMTGPAQMARPHQRRGMPTRTYARTHARTHPHTRARGAGPRHSGGMAARLGACPGSSADALGRARRRECFKVGQALGAQQHVRGSCRHTSDITRDGTRAHNLLLTGGAPYPLGHTSS